MRLLVRCERVFIEYSQLVAIEVCVRLLTARHRSRQVAVVLVGLLFLDDQLLVLNIAAKLLSFQLALEFAAVARVFDRHAIAASRVLTLSVAADAEVVDDLVFDGVVGLCHRGTRGSCSSSCPLLLKAVEVDLSLAQLCKLDLWAVSIIAVAPLLLCEIVDQAHF